MALNTNEQLTLAEAAIAINNGPAEEVQESKLVEYRKVKTKQPIFTSQKRPTRPLRSSKAVAA